MIRFNVSVLVTIAALLCSDRALANGPLGASRGKQTVTAAPSDPLGTKARNQTGTEITPSTRYYFVIGQPTNGTTRSASALDRAARTVLRKELSRLPGAAVASAHQTPSQTQALLAKYAKVKAIYIWPKVTVVQCPAGLKLEFNLAVFTYPGKVLVGSISRSATLLGALPDPSTEDELLAMAAEQMAKTLERTASRI